MHLTDQIDELRKARSKDEKKDILKALRNYSAKEFSSSDIAFIAELLHDDAPSVRAKSAELLGHCKALACVDSLIQTCSDKIDEVAFAAAVSLGNIGDSKAQGAIQKVMEKFSIKLDKVISKRGHHPLILPTIDRSNMMRTFQSFYLSDRLGHDKASSRESRYIDELEIRIAALKRAIENCLSSSQAAVGDVGESQICPRGHGPLKIWDGKLRCWTCGWPAK